MDDLNNQSKEPKFVLMFSGGLDSYLALLTLLDNGIDPELVYSEHGSRNSAEQFIQAEKLAGLVGMEIIKDQSLRLRDWEEASAFIPNRNGFLAMVGALYGDFIYFAIMDGEQEYPDCRPETFMSMSMALTNLSGRPVVVESPFWELTKAEIIESLDPMYYDALKMTYSCHTGGDIHCGECSACFRRFCAFELNGIDEEWEVEPWETDLAMEYLEKAMMNFYGDKRSQEILGALKSKGVTPRE